LSISLPAAFIDSLKQLEYFDEKSFKNAHTKGQQVTSVRFNPYKTFDISFSSLSIESGVPWCPFGKYLHERPFFTFDPLLHAGAYYVQEASSMFLWHALKQTTGENTAGLRVLDLCAAPGGKSTLLASYFTNGLVVANELIRSRANILTENITKWGADNVVVTCNEPQHFTNLKNYFDVIVVDAPCSGSGLFRKDPAAINEWGENSVAACSQRQQRILADIYPALKQGGLLIYSTCSYSKEEDEDISDWLKAGFEVQSLKLETDSNWGIIETVTEKNNYGYRFFPDKLKGEGFFIAAFKKLDGALVHQHQSAITAAPKQETAIAGTWVKNNNDLFYFKQAENILAIPAQWKQDIALLQKNLYLRKAGIAIGALKRTDMVPNHELALSHLLSDNTQRINVSKADALLYLKRKEIVTGDMLKGWAIITYGGLGIGWAKVLHNRINNYYPAGWRILKD